MSCNAVRLKHEVGVGTVQRIAREMEEDNDESKNSKN